MSRGMEQSDPPHVPRWLVELDMKTIVNGKILSRSSTVRGSARAMAFHLLYSSDAALGRGADAIFSQSQCVDGLVSASPAYSPAKTRKVKSCASLFYVPCS